MDTSSKLKNKISPLIEGQVPDFVQADHPLFVTFLKHYYEFLESGELKLTLNLDHVIQETFSSRFILDETNGEKIILESGVGSTGKFVNGETITGSTSGATAKVLVEDTSNGRLFISAQQKFITGEIVTGSTSNSNGTITSYRGNPVQNIQQLIEYAKPDNTIDDFLDNFRNQFMNAIPSTLADGISKRNLLKSIKELYTAKGTSEGHKFFLRILLDDDASILYPEKYMLRVSSGNWGSKETIRTTIPTGVDPAEFVGQKLSSLIRDTNAIVVSALTLTEGLETVAEYELDNIVGTFVIDEVVEIISKTTDLVHKFNVRGILTKANINAGGILHTKAETIATDSSIGNGLAITEVNEVGLGSVDEIFIDDVGTKYRVGDTLTFNAGSQSNTDSADGFVSVVGGMFILEDDTGGQILLEESTTSSPSLVEISLEDEVGILYQENGTTNTTLTSSPGPILIESNPLSLDSYGTLTDGLVIEDGTFANLSAASEEGSLRKVFLKKEGAGYSDLPTVTINSNSGSGGLIKASTSTIGNIEDINIKNVGFNYTTAPRPEFKIKLLVKDISGTFNTGSAVNFGTFNSGVAATTGTVSAVDLTKNIITITPTKAMPYFIKQEDGTTVATTFGDDLLTEDGSFLINENSFYSGEKDVTISTSAATATIVKSSLAEADLIAGVVATSIGSYPIDGLHTLGEAVTRLQDSHYYQQFSYEIQVGASLQDFLASLKKAVHPAGFQPFGKVTIASKIAAGINVITGKDAPGYTGDTDTFTPELASTFYLVYDTAFGRRLGTADDGTSVNASPMSTINENFLTDSNLGRTSNKRELTLTPKMELELSISAYNTSNPNALKILNRFPYMNATRGIELESGTHETGAYTSWDDTSTYTMDDNNTPPTFDMGAASYTGSIVLDGIMSTHSTTFVDGAGTVNTVGQVAHSIGDKVIPEDGSTTTSSSEDGSSPRLDVVGSLAFVEFYKYHVLRLESDDEADNILLDGTDSNGANSGDNLLVEDSEQLSDKLPWPDSIWNHNLEKRFTYPATIDVRSG